MASLSPSKDAIPVVSDPLPIEDAFSSASRSFSQPLRLPLPLPPVLAAAAPLVEPSAPPVERSAPPTSVAAPLSPAPPTVGAASPRSGKADVHVLRQAAAHQTQALRAMVHRAAADMESWRTSVGTSQLEELFTYWATFVSVTQRGVKVNERVLNFMRASASALAGFAAGMHAAGAQLAPVASGEALGSAAPSAARPLSLAALASSVRDVQHQAVVVATELAANVSRMLVGDEDGPLGRPARRPVAAGALDAVAPPPGDLASVAAWYAACAGELRDGGTVLEVSVREGQHACARAYADLDSLIAAHMSGEPKRVAAARGKDVWLAELRHRRACRALLALKARYLAGMASLFERFRRVECQRSEALGAVCDAYGALLARTFERASGARGTFAGVVKELNAHLDLCRVADAEARTAIAELRAAAVARGGAPPPPSPRTSAPPAGGFASYEASGLSSIAPPTINAAAAPASLSGISFLLEAAPAVITPFASPLVVRCGLLLRQSDILRSWKPSVGVLTRDAQLHLFALDEDLATHPDVIAAFFKLASGGCAGHGGTARDVHAFLEATQHYTAAAQQAEAAASVAAIVDAAGAGAVADQPSASSRAASRLVRPTVGLPPPALPSGHVSFAAAYAAKADDYAALGVDALALAKAAGSSPSVSFACTPSTHVAFVPAVHAHAFELREERGLFAGGTHRLVMRANSDGDAAAWVLALNTILETLA